MWSRNRVGKDQEAKESADVKDPGEARGIFTDCGGLKDPARQGHMTGKYSEATARGWHSPPGGKRASPLPTDRPSVPGWVLRGRPRRSEPRVGSLDRRHQLPRRHQRTQRAGRSGSRRAAAAGTGSGVRRGCLSTCSLPQLLLLPAPVPPPGTGRGASPGEEGWRGGRPASDSRFASPGHPRSGTPPRCQTADLGGQTCCLTDFPASL